MARRCESHCRRTDHASSSCRGGDSFLYEGACCQASLSSWRGNANLMLTLPNVYGSMANGLLPQRGFDVHAKIRDRNQGRPKFCLRPEALIGLRQRHIGLWRPITTAFPYGQPLPDYRGPSTPVEPGVVFKCDLGRACVILEKSETIIFPMNSYPRVLA